MTIELHDGDSSPLWQESIERRRAPCGHPGAARGRAFSSWRPDVRARLRRRAPVEPGRRPDRGFVRTYFAELAVLDPAEL